MIVKTVNFHRNSLARFFLIFLVDWAMFVLAFEKSEVSLLLVGFLGLEILPPLLLCDFINFGQYIMMGVINLKTTLKSVLTIFRYCGRRDSNSHEGCSLEPKSSASTNFATSALL